MYFYVFLPTNLTKLKKKSCLGPINRTNTMEKKIKFLKIKSYFLNFQFTLSPHQALPLFHAHGPMAMATCFDQVNRERELRFSLFPLYFLCFSSSHLNFSISAGEKKSCKLSWQFHGRRAALYSGFDRND